MFDIVLYCIIIYVSYIMLVPQKEDIIIDDLISKIKKTNSEIKRIGKSL